MVRGKLYWHTQRDVLFGCFYNNYGREVERIRETTPPDECSIRLRLMQPIKGQLPEAIEKANAACDKTYNAWLKACEANREARRTHKAEMEALHAKDCGCKEWNGSEIIIPGQMPTYREAAPG